MAAQEKTALVADPSREERARLAALLGEFGFARVLEAEDGLAALRLVESALPDALLISATLRPGWTRGSRAASPPRSIPWWAAATTSAPARWNKACAMRSSLRGSAGGSTSNTASFAVR